MDDKLLESALKHISPADCTYQDWITVGMGLHAKGASVTDWDEWSKADSRYKPGECYKKWASFGSDSGGVTAGTIIDMAEARGWEKPKHKFGINPFELLADPWDNAELDDDILMDAYKLPKRLYPVWDPVKEITTYISTLFNPYDYVGYVTQTYQNDDGKWLPASKGAFRETAQAITTNFNTYNETGPVIGQLNPEAGAWIRFNPFDGKGIEKANVTRFDYALVESDDLPLDEQEKILRDLNVPIACLVFSGSKSLHAIVRVDAVDAEQYSQRVNTLYEILRKNKFIPDRSNRNPNKLSRMPGCQRGEKQQYLVAVNIGAENWESWIEEREGDDLPETENFDDFIESDIELAPEIVSGVLRQGHKMILAGPSKAGKSFLLMELCMAVASGTEWLGRKCKQGPVLYINLEIDARSEKKRFQEIAKKLNLSRFNGNLDTWNLRGCGRDMNQLKKAVIKKLTAKNYAMFVIDPIYKVLTGDENSASDMSRFSAIFDEICNTTGASAVYAHHFSKGKQGQKSSMDRASGSGVFARDPDAMAAMTELRVPDADISKWCEKDVIPLAEELLRIFDYDKLTEVQARNRWIRPKKDAGQEAWQAWYEDRNYPNLYCTDLIDTIEDMATVCNDDDFLEMKENVLSKYLDVLSVTGWEIDWTLREFRTPQPDYMYFDYPVHRLETNGLLSHQQLKEGGYTSDQLADLKRDKDKDAEKKKLDELDSAIESYMDENGVDEVTPYTMAQYARDNNLKGLTSVNTIKQKISKSLKFETVKRADGRLVIKCQK